MYEGGETIENDQKARNIVGDMTRFDEEGEYYDRI